MSNEKPVLIFAFVDCMGGIPSFYRNIINNSKFSKSFYIKVVLIKALEDDRPATLDKFEVDEIISFRYSFDDNQYYVQKSLANHLGYDRGALVTDTSIAIEAKVRFKVPKTLFHLIHDFFYVHQQFKYQQVIDVVITHSSFFRDAIFASDPQLFSGRNFYIPYGVKQLTTFPQKRNNSILNLVFLGRLDELKGVFLLNEIDDLLLGLKIPVNWTIIGKGHSKEKLLIQWQGKNNVQFFEPDTTEAVYELLADKDIFVFPTSFEGTPVSIMECISNGIVTITNNLPGGIRDMVTEKVGFLCQLNDTKEFANHIKKLYSDRQLLFYMQNNCFEEASKSYDVTRNADKYFELFGRFDEFRKEVNSHSLPSLKFDNPFLPNFLMVIVRKAIRFRQRKSKKA